MSVEILRKELVDVFEWFNFGLALGLSYAELKIIEKNYQFVAERKIEVFGLWLKRKKCSWFDIMKALIGIKMNRLAKQIAKNYGKISCI